MHWNNYALQLTGWGGLEVWQEEVLLHWNVARSDRLALPCLSSMARGKSSCIFDDCASACAFQLIPYRFAKIRSLTSEYQ